jgi:cation transport regulator ChaC
MIHETTLFVFAYGSNMSLPRITSRVPSARPIATGHVRRRRLAFHKRSVDGSGKADAVATGRFDDLLWGVVYEVSHPEKTILDEHEFLGIGYDEHRVQVHSAIGQLEAWIYVARPEAIDSSLRPYSWYLDYLIDGAMAHGLPESYLAQLRRVPAISDPNQDRHRRNGRIIQS